MFLSALFRTNEPLADFAAVAVRDGLIPPGAFLIDLDTVAENAEAIASTARQHGVALYAMSKQVGRNPEFIRAVSFSIPDWVAVDLVDARAVVRAGGRVAHVGHLVQPGPTQVSEVLELAPDFVTVFSAALAEGLSREAARRGSLQPIMARVAGAGDSWHPGQEGGITLDAFPAFADEVRGRPGVRLAGVTSYPCFVAQGDELKPSPNAASVLEAARLVSGISQINGPGNTCVAAIPLLAELGFTHGEPGHGLTGTTPIHATRTDLPERVAVAYATAISHRIDGERAAVLGGGFYARSRAREGCVYSSRGQLLGTLEPHPAEAIDYYRTLRVGRDALPGDPVIFSFRYQAFVTRAPIATVKGLRGKPRVVGIHDSFGHPWS